MIISKLRLQDFRLYTKKEFAFEGKNTLIVGQNTVGKTNILEAIYLLASGKSFRAGLESEMISYDQEIARVKGRIENEEITDLEIVLTRGEVGGEKTAKKKFLVNGVSRRMFDFVGKLKAVYFRPEDLDLVTDSPSLRRKYLDMVLGQVDKEYLRNLLSFEKGLRQRNKLLERIREEGVSRSQLLFWDQLLIRTGNYLTNSRGKFIDFCNQQPTTSNKQQIKLDYQLEYDKSVISPARLEEYAVEEVAAASTLVGPHRDDFCFLLKNRELHAFGSRGEQRLGVLWLKLAELEFIYSQTNERPALLLDDIFSELDEKHRELVMEVIPKQQTIITTTDLNLVAIDCQEKMEVIKLS
jgi:DNA replication and repair protein RecF